MPVVNFIKAYFLKPICWILVIIGALYILNLFTFFNISLGSNNSYNSFEVIGTGTVKATPNVATTSFTVSEKGTTQEAAKNAANQKQNQALKELESIGIAKADITTDGFNVQPNYEASDVQPIYPPRPAQQNGYVATITTQVKSKDISKINKAIDGLTALGFNVSGVSYDFASKTQYQEEAQAKAIENAKEQAQNMAKAAGIKIGKIITIRNADDQYNGVQPYAEGVALKSNDTSTNLQPGENEVTSHMGVTFEIKN